MSKKLFITLVFVLLIVGFALVASPSKKQNQDKKEIVLGGIYSLSGDNAVLGQAERNASLLAIEEINAGGGINGSPISVIWEVGKCSGKDGLTAAQKLISVDRIHIILAGGCSSEVLGFAPLAEKEKVITMDITGTSPDIAQAGERIFRNVPNDSYAAAALAEYARKRGYVRAATLFEETDYAKALNRDFIALFKARDGDVVTQESFLTTSKDIRTQATRIKSLNPEIIFLAPQSSKSGIMAAKQLKELGVGAPLLTSAEVLLTGDEKEFQLMKELFEGAVLSQLDFEAVDKSRLNDFNKRYKETYLSLDNIIHCCILWIYGSNRQIQH